MLQKKRSIDHTIDHDIIATNFVNLGTDDETDKQ